MAIRGRGPQVVLEGYARTVARGAAGPTMRANIAAMDALTSAGLVADGNAVDGSSRTGGQPYDIVVAQFPHEPLSAWEVPAPYLDLSESTGGSGGGQFNVQDFGAVGNGSTDDAPIIQQVIYAAAGHGTVRFPGTQKQGGAPAIYIIMATLLVPSNSHLLIEAPATIMIGNGSNCAACFQIVANATSIAVDLYGTLDGNVTQQAIGGSPSGAITGQGNVPCSNVLIRGFNSGVISNWKNWGFNLTQATNCEVNGVTFTNNGNSIEFAGLTHHIAVNTAGSSYTNSGATVLVTASPHGLVPGQTFTFYGITSDVQFSWLFGEYVAGPGTAGTTVNFTGPVNLNIPVFNPGASTSSVGTSSKCYNVGFVDCVVQDTQDLGILMYGGVVGGYVRNCEVTGCQGPFIFSDNAQPGSNWDCEISGCYSHDNPGGGPTVTCNQLGIVNHRTRVFNNISANNMGGGIAIAAVDGAEVFDNLLHNNAPTNTTALPLAGICSNLLLGSHTNLRVWDNTISDPQPAWLTRTNSHINAGTYDSVTGAVTLTTAAAHNVPLGGSFRLGPLRGTGAVASLKGWYTATAVTTTTLSFTGPTGLAALTIFDGNVNYYAPFPANNSVASGTYDGSTGNVVLTTTTAHGYVAGTMFLLANVAGANVAPVIGLQVATAGTSGTTLTFTEAANLPAMTITGGAIYPPNVGIAVYPDSFIANFAALNTRIISNSIGDNQSPANLGAAIGGIWGGRGYSGDNNYGNRLSLTADVSNYAPTIGGDYNSSGSVQGPSNDDEREVSLGNYIVRGGVTFQGNPGDVPRVTPAVGMTPGWNASGSNAEVDLYCGRSSVGQGGGFSFIQVGLVGTDGVVDTTVGVGGSLFASDGHGNARLGGGLVHGAMQTVALVNAGTVTVNKNTSFVLIRNSTSIASASVVLPAPDNLAFAAGAELELNFQNPVTALAVTAAVGASVVNPPTAIATAGASVSFINSGTTWLRRIAI